MQKILVIAAHPDDEVLGCGGTIARLAAEGNEVTVAILGEGGTSRSARREDADLTTVEDLREAGRKSGQVLGVADMRFFDLPDNRFDSLPLLEVVKVIEQLVDEVAPRVVYTQHGGDLNIDHQVTFRATLTAVRPMAESSVDALYAYEVPSSSEWAFGKFAPEFKPDVFMDVSRTFSAKIEAMACYAGEQRKFPHPRSPEAMEALAKWRGSQVGLLAAEAFDTVFARK